MICCAVAYPLLARSGRARCGWARPGRFCRPRPGAPHPGSAPARAIVLMPPGFCAGARACCVIPVRANNTVAGVAAAAACRSLSTAGWMTRACGSVRHGCKGCLHLFWVVLQFATPRTAWTKPSHRLMLGCNAPKQAHGHGRAFCPEWRTNLTPVLCQQLEGSGSLRLRAVCH